jgi:transmembrane sensor
MLIVFIAPPTAPDTAAYATLQMAAAWFATLQASDASANDHARWERWLAAAPAHRAAWRKIEAVHRQAGRLPAPPHPRRGAAKKLLLLAGAVAFGALAASRENRDYLVALVAGERTDIGEIRQLALPDGTQLWMNTDSALDLDATSAQRRIALQRGEILFDGSASSRPVAVDVLGARLTARGARFGVHRTADTVALSVFNGAVQVALDGTTRIARAGTRVRFGAGWVGAEEAADASQQAWTTRRLSVARMRLADFTATVARYRHGYLDCHPAVAGLLLTGSFSLDNIEHILGTLETTLPVRVKRVLPWWATLEPV